MKSPLASDKYSEKNISGISVFENNDDENISRHLAFRDYLRAHRNVADEYAALKRVLALKFPYDIEGYSDGKDDFVKRIEKAALEEYGKQSYVSINSIFTKDS